MADLSLRNIYKVYEGDVTAVKDFNLEIADKEFIVFVGPSGCGKSTTLRMIAGLETPDNGKIIIDEKEVFSSVSNLQPKDRGIAVVFQNYALLPHLSIASNITFGSDASKADLEEVLEKTKLNPFLIIILPFRLKGAYEEWKSTK